MAVVEQVVAAAGELETCEAAIEAKGADVNRMVFSLYGLTSQEKALVAAG